VLWAKYETSAMEKAKAAGNQIIEVADKKPYQMRSNRCGTSTVPNTPTSSTNPGGRLTISCRNARLSRASTRDTAKPSWMAGTIGAPSDAVL